MSEQRTDEETGNVIRTIYYVYDANGQPVGMKYNGVQYWYQKNMQGDVVRILNASGAEVVSYDNLVEYNGYNGAKEKGLVRSEGKEYVVQDGDVVLFRFNV